jgi:RimJ/RimL family protein N-acetyltransferase
VEVETERLWLRPLARRDADALRPLHQDPLMMRYFGDGHTYADDESRTWLEWHVAMWDLEGYGFWAVERKPDRDFLGWLGVTKVWEPPELLPASEVGWFVDRRAWGQGLATEGARAALRFAFGPLLLPRVIARYNAENVASGRVMEKIGMRFWQEAPHPELPGVRVRIYEATAGQRPAP